MILDLISEIPLLENLLLIAQKMLPVFLYFSVKRIGSSQMIQFAMILDLISELPLLENLLLIARKMLLVFLYYLC